MAHGAGLRRRHAPRVTRDGRSRDESETTDLLNMRDFGVFRLDQIEQCVWQRHDQKETRKPLTPKAFAVLWYLVEHAGRVVSQDELLEKIWPGVVVQPEVLKNHIVSIRSVLGDTPKDPKFIETHSKRGYRFIAPLAEPACEMPASVESARQKFVGRREALGELDRCFHTSLRNQRQITFVTGELGIGKTALLDEFLRNTDGHSGVRTIRGQCIEGYAGNEPYYPVLEAIGQLCSSPAADSVVGVLTSRAPTWLVQFPVLVKSELRGMLQREILGATRERMLREIVDALDAIAANAPLLLVLDDLHWADPSTVDFISAVARGIEPSKLMLVGAYRPADVTLSDHPLNKVVKDLLVRRLCREIALGSLGLSDVAEYLGAVNLSTPPEGLASLVHRHSDGNPLFMMTVLSDLRDRGFVDLEHETWELRVPLESIHLEVPDSLRRLIELKIDRLSVAEQRALEVASVLRRFSLSVLVGAAVAEVSPGAFEEVMEVLAQKQGLIRRAGARQYRQGIFGCYEFVHVLFRQVVYDRMGPSRRRRLHRHMGDRAEALTLISDAETASELAYQFEEGEDWLRAVRHFRTAADVAGRRFEPMQAVAILEHALELVRRIPEGERAQHEIEILERLGSIHVIRFDSRAVPTYEALIGRARHYGRIDDEIRAEFAMGLQLHRVSTQLYLASLDRALERSSQQEPDARERTKRTYRLLRLFGDWIAAEADGLIEQYAETRQRGEMVDLRSLMFYSLVHFYGSRYREAIRLAKQAFDRTMTESDRNPHLSDIYMMYQQMISSMYLCAGDWGSALRESAAHMDTATKNGNVGQAQGGRLNAAWLHLEALDFAGAHGICESVLPYLESPLLVGRRRLCTILAACANIGQGKLDCALENLLAVRSEMAQHPQVQDRQSRMFLELGLTEARLAEGNMEQAEMEGWEFLRIVLNDRGFQAAALEVNARIYLARGNLRESQNNIEAALRLLKEYELPLANWRVHATAFDLHTLLGNWDRAHEHRKTSQDEILKLGGSLPEEQPLRRVFLSAPATLRILDAG